MKISRTCKQCGDTFQAEHWNVARGRANFCSRHCVYVMLSQLPKRRKSKPKKK